jgi:ABC-2 type transport system ATP-binding protein
MLDEPTSALDPIGRREVLEMIASLRGRTTVFFSTHILADVERVCDAVAILESGHVVANASVAELRARSAANRLTVEVEDTGAVLAMTRALTGQPWLRSIDTVDRTLRLTVSDLPAAQRDVPAVIAAAGVALRRFEIEEGSLEDVFVDLVGGASQ